MNTKKLPGHGVQRSDDRIALGHALKMGNLREYLSGQGLPVPDFRETPTALPPSRLKPWWPDAKRAALAWLEDNGAPARGDGRQGVLESHIGEWLQARGHEAAPSTIRRHVVRWITEFRGRLGVTAS